MSLETTSSSILPRFCLRCGAEVESSAYLCSSCGVPVTGSQQERDFGAFSFHSRWLIVVLVIAVLASTINPYFLSLGIAAYISLVVIRNKLSLSALIGRMPSGYNWWLLILMGIGAISYSIGATTVVYYPLAQLNSELIEDLLFEPSFSDSLGSSFLLLVILAPLLEETVFRGLLFSRLAKKWGITKAMIVSSLAFGLLHLNPIGAFVFGIITCVLYVRTRTLLAPMALHALNNLIAWAFMATISAGEIDSTSPEFLAQFAYQGLIAMMLGAPIVFILLGRWWPSRATPMPYEVNVGDRVIRASREM